MRKWLYLLKISTFVYIINFFPKYSPFLNMTELANCTLKAAVKRHLSQPSTIAQLNDNSIVYNNGITFCHHRMSILKSVVSENLSTITQKKCKSLLNHIFSYTISCRMWKPIVRSNVFRGVLIHFFKSKIKVNYFNEIFCSGL